MKGFWYLGSAYSHVDPKIRGKRYHEARAALAYLLRVKLFAYSPIVMCHDLAKANALPYEAEYWTEFNYEMLNASRGMIVLVSDGYAQSKGLRDEVALARSWTREVKFLHKVKGGYELQLTDLP